MPSNLLPLLRSSFMKLIEMWLLDWKRWKMLNFNRVVVKVLMNG